MKTIVCLLFLFPSVAICQNKYDWNQVPQTISKKTADPQYSVPNFERDVLTPIDSTNAILEIRYYSFGHGGRRGIFVLRCYDDSVIVQQFTRETDLNRKMPVSGEDSAFYNAGGNYYKWTIKTFPADSIPGLIQTFAASGFFNGGASDSITNAAVNGFLEKSGAKTKGIRYNIEETVWSNFVFVNHGIKDSFPVKYLKYVDENVNVFRGAVGIDMAQMVMSFLSGQKSTHTKIFRCRSIEP